MFLAKLNLTHFRLFRKISFEFHEHINLIHGLNAQGKTSLLESMRVLSTSRSFITTRNREMVTFGENHFFLGAQLYCRKVPFELKYGWSANKRAVSINQQPLHILSDLLGRFDTVLLTGADDALIKGNPEIRRRYLDIQLSQGNPKYLYNLKTYRTVLKHRNALLKRKRLHSKELKVWTERLVECGAYLIRDRILAASRLEAFANHFLQRLSGTRDYVNLSYRSLTDSTQLATIQNHFKRLLEQRYTEERHHGYTLTGPHRDDLYIACNGQEARKYASRGQTKSIAISLRIAESDHLKSMKNDWPVFLMDDIVSDLDVPRQKAILSMLHPHQQIFLVATDKDAVLKLIPDDHPVLTLEIDQGQIISTSHR